MRDLGHSGRFRYECAYGTGDQRHQVHLFALASVIWGCGDRGI